MKKKKPEWKQLQEQLIKLISHAKDEHNMTITLKLLKLVLESKDV